MTTPQEALKQARDKIDGLTNIIKMAARNIKDQRMHYVESLAGSRIYVDDAISDAKRLVTEIDSVLDSAQPAPAVPEGWQIVPKEPTPEMLTAGDNAGDDIWTVESSYAAMLAAAPAPAPVGAQPVQATDILKRAKQACAALYRKDKNVMEMRDEIERRDRFNGAVSQCINAIDALSIQAHPVQQTANPKYSDIVSDGGMDPRNK